MAITTTTQIASPVNVIYQKELLENAKPLCPYFVGSDPAVIEQGNGSATAKWRRYENLTVSTSPLTELSSEAYPTRSTTRPTVNDLTATVQKYGTVISLTEEVDLFNYNEVNMGLMRIMGINAGQTLNRLQRNELEDNSTIEYGGSATTATGVTAKIVANDVKKVVNLLNRASAMKFTPMSTGQNADNTVPQRPAYIGICHPDIEEDVRGFTGFVPVEQYAGQVSVYDGEFGSFGGVRFVSTPEASIDANAGGVAAGGVRTTGGTLADLYTTVIMGQNHHGSLGLDTAHIKECYEAGDQLPAVMMISKEAGSAGTADPLDEIRTIAWKSWHAAKVFTNSTTPTTGEWGYALVTGAGELS